ncbi:MAG: hypothetical protein GX366_05170 [Epulopiscium sp.]|nr:hypothetical protein [Candidatus Epulonipiscium sp.]
MSENTSNEVGKLVRWASELASKYNGDTTTVLVQFRRLRKAGAGIDQAKKEMEEVYELGAIL